MATKSKQSRRKVAALPAGKMGGINGDEVYDHLHLALEAADIGIWDWELASNRMMMSDNMKKLLDIDIVHRGSSFKTFIQSIHHADRACIDASLNKAIAQRGSFDVEFRVEKSDRSIHWMRIRGRVSIGVDGEPERVMGSIHDKTERKVAYDALESARSELEEKVKERTLELLNSNEQLRKEIALKNNLQKQIMEISEKEQRRIGQDLHDSLSQQLGGILFMGQVLFEKLKKIGPDEARSMEKLMGHLQNALTYTRDLARGLYPTLGKGGLVAALKELAVAVAELFSVTVTVECEKGANTSDEVVTIHIYRIVQEALNNSIKHGKATCIAIRLSWQKGTVVLAVMDNGVGFPEKPNKKGMGLNIMQYRASSIGSSFEIATKRNGGTVVKCVFNESSVFGGEVKAGRFCGDEIC
jgi:signal transduction histidine kinase